MVIDAHNHVGVDLLFYLTRSFPYGQDLPTLVTVGGALGVDRWVVFPMVSHLALSIPAMRDGRISVDGALERVPYAFENARLLHELEVLFPELGARTLPFLMVDPLREPEGQAAAIRQTVSRHRIFGLKIQSTILQAPIRHLLEEGRALLAVAADLDLPFLIHSSVAPTDHWAQAADILDIAEAWPQVRFCLAHSCRFDLPCLERLASLPNTWFDCSAHRIHCRCAVDNLAVVAPPERRFQTDYRDPGRVLHDLAEAFPDRLIWGSDSPFYSYVAEHEGRLLELKSSYADEVAALQSLPPALRERVACANVKRFLQRDHE